MHELTIPRSKLARGIFDPDIEGRCCPIGHVLIAAGAVWPEDEDGRDSVRLSYIHDDPPELARSLFPLGRNGQLALGVHDAVRDFDVGNEGRCLAALRDFGWNVTIQEDA